MKLFIFKNKFLTSDVCDLGHINANLYNRIKIQFKVIICDLTNQSYVSKIELYEREKIAWVKFRHACATCMCENCSVVFFIGWNPPKKHPLINTGPRRN